MKNNHVIVLCLLAASTACASFQEESVNTERAKVESDEVFYATLEQSGVADATKVYADENLQVLWNADDRISIYNYYTYGYEYAFQGTTGKTAGAFAKVADDAEFVTGNSLDKIYAVYPYSIDNEIDNDGVLSLTWPSPQTYKAESFGIGANVMVSVTDDNQLRFRNVGGYLAIKLYGDNISVSSITLRGNNGEKLAGRTTVTCASDAEPPLTFQSASSESIRLECPAPVSIGNSAESATTFWLVVPPTEFTQGFNITVRTSDGLVFYKSTDIAYEIERNTLTRMAAVEVVPGDIIPFADANFKAYCVENFDTDNDGDISLSEALAVNTIDVNTDNIYSLDGVEYFTNLRVLYARGSAAKYENCVVSGDTTYLPDAAEGTSVASGKLSRVFISGLMYLQDIDISQNNCIVDFTPSNCPSLRIIRCEFCNIISLDVSQNFALVSLDCSYNQLTALDVSNNTALTSLYCDSNQLSSLDVSNNLLLSHIGCCGNHLSFFDVTNNVSLTALFCSSNQLTSLDVRTNTMLDRLECFSNQLTSLDLANNPALTCLWCGSNQLTSLELTNNTALTFMECQANQLASLDVSNNTALIQLRCGYNQVTSLDVSHNTSLTELWCSSNQLTSLDVSNNTVLIRLDCYNNQLTSLNVSYNTALAELDCGYNQLTALDVSHNTALTTLFCGDNQLTALGVSNNTALGWLDCRYNQLTALDVSNNTVLTVLWCWYNQLTSLDLSNNTALADLCCYGNPSLTEIWLKTGQTIQSLSYDSSVAQIHYKD